MISRIIFLLIITQVLACHKNSPLSPEPLQLAELPYVRVSTLNYNRSEIYSRVPDTIYWNKCNLAYKYAVTDSLKRYMADVFLQKARWLAQETPLASECLNATGQLKQGVVSLLYFAERAQYESKESWIFEFSWGDDLYGIGHYRCFVMDTSTRDTLLFVTCR